MARYRADEGSLELEVGEERVGQGSRNRYPSWLASGEHRPILADVLLSLLESAAEPFQLFESENT